LDSVIQTEMAIVKEKDQMDGTVPKGDQDASHISSIRGDDEVSTP
jgi:hypothetical protein